jgi:hypothetical protein
MNRGRVRSTRTGMIDSAARHESSIASGMRPPKSRMPRYGDHAITAKPAPIDAATKRTARPDVRSATLNACASSVRCRRSSRRR